MLAVDPLHRRLANLSPSQERAAVRCPIVPLCINDSHAGYV